MSIDVKQAIKAAFSSAKELYEGDNISNLRLEAVEFNSSRNEWLVTIGFDTGRTVTKTTRGPLMMPETIQERERVYKVFHIDAKGGQLKKMLIAQP